MLFSKNERIDTERVKKDFEFLKNEYGFDMINEETASYNDCIFVLYSNRNGREIKIVRDSGYYEVETNIGEGYISYIAKYLNKNGRFRIEYKGFDGYISLVKDSRKKISMVNASEEKINQEEIDKYFKENAERIEWMNIEET
jgi:hypothetical protein